MKIAINCAFFQPRGGGIKEYIQNLVENLSKLDKNNEYILYVLEDYYDYAKENLGTRFQIKAIPFKGSGLANVIYRSLFEKYFWAKEEKQEKWDIFHSPFFHSHTPRKAKLLLTVHDMRFFRYPETYTYLRGNFLKHAVRRSIRNADKVISISQFTKNEIMAAYNTDSDKITVIHEAINPDHFSDSSLSTEDRKLILGIENKPFILTVGHLEPRKNYERLISAFQKIKSDLKNDTKLLIIGKKGHDYNKTISEIEKDPDILYLNFVSQELLNWLYKNTSLFVFPSFYEGFGFPPLEAGIHGSISAVSNVSSMPEVCGEAALYFDPLDIEDMAKQIKTGLENDEIRTQLKENVKERISFFSWAINAQETISVYESLNSKKL